METTKNTNAAALERFILTLDNGEQIIAHATGRDTAEAIENARAFYPTHGFQGHTVTNVSHINQYDGGAPLDPSMAVMDGLPA